jgi:protocatechuate 3,4-dioxygenase beta subunit
MASCDLWVYENQEESQPDYNLRGRFTTDENGSFELVALMPTAYPVPTDGPVGEFFAHRQTTSEQTGAYPFYRGGARV